MSATARRQPSAAVGDERAHSPSTLAFVDSVPAPVMVVDAGGRIRRANGEALAQLGLRPLGGLTVELTCPSSAAREGAPGRVEVRVFEGGATVLECVARSRPLVGSDLTTVLLGEAALDAVDAVDAVDALPVPSARDVAAFGAADLTNGVIHNVANALNSVSVIAETLRDRLQASAVGNVVRVARLLEHHADDLVAFVRDTPQGAELPRFLTTIAERLTREVADADLELAQLQEVLDHMAAVMRTQQALVKAEGSRDVSTPADLLALALALDGDAYRQANVAVELAVDADIGPAVVERHIVVQILVNLLSNARHAIRAAPGAGPRWVRIRGYRPQPERLALEVTDSGIGIAAEQLPELFKRGFSTRRTGHGIGLPVSRFLAEAAGGSLHASSDGPGRGATFTLELPWSDLGQGGSP